MVRSLTAFCLLDIAIGLLFTFYPEKAAWLRYVLKKGTTRNVSPPEDTVKMMRLFGIIMTIAATAILSSVL